MYFLTCDFVLFDHMLNSTSHHVRSSDIGQELDESMDATREGEAMEAIETGASTNKQLDANRVAELCFTTLATLGTLNPIYLSFLCRTNEQ